MKELPYFKFYPTEWVSGDIAHVPTLGQGFFVKFLVLAWIKGGYVAKDDLFKQKLNICSTDDEQVFKILTDHKIIEEKDGKLFVKFQIEQIEDYIESLKKKSKAGRESVKKRIEKKLNNKGLQKLTGVEQVLTSCLNTNSTQAQHNSTIEIEIESKKEIEIEKENIRKGISLLFRRKDSTKWTDKENAQLNAICKRPDVSTEFEEIKNLYESGYKYRRQDVITFLNNWAGELDKARNYKPEVPKGMAAGQIHHEEGELKWTE